MSPLFPSGCLLKKIAMFVLWSALLMSLVQPAKAQNVTQAPAYLTFGIPTGTTPAVSAAQTVTLNISLAAGVNLTFSNPSATITPNPSAFSITGNSCTGQYTGPFTGTCQVTVVFSSQSTTLQTASLQISGGGFELPAVPLSGAFGAIKLWDATSVQPSFNGPVFTTLKVDTIASANLKLSCPAEPVAILSNTPDGLGNVMVDNFITLAINNQPLVKTYLQSSVPANLPPNLQSNVYEAVYANNGLAPAYPLGNVCQNTDAFSDFDGTNYYPECFSAAYRGDVTNLIGVNADSIANANGLIPSLGDGSAGGVAPLNISTFFSSGTMQASLNAVDYGGYFETSTVFLVTNCSPTGIASGGSITGVPITAGNTASQTQTFTFDSTPNQNISFTSSDAVAIQSGSTTPTGVTPIVTDIGISQAAFSELIKGTSAAPVVCYRLFGETDAAGNPLCKGFLIQCFNPADGTTSGSNCDTPAANATLMRNLYDASQFSSPDAPVNGTNFLYNNGATDACTFFTNAQQGVANGSCAPTVFSGSNPTTLMGAAFLLGSDSWLIDGVCSLTGLLAGDQCPLNTSTVLRGAADNGPGGGTSGRNSVYVAGANAPLPFSTNVSVSGPGNPPAAAKPNPWVNSEDVTAQFTANSATYLGGANNPSANTFVTSPVYSWTFGTTKAFDANGNPIPLPDPIYPVPGDTTIWNNGVSKNFVAPLCPAGTSTTFTSNSGGNPNVPNPLAQTLEGIYNLHYFTTACDLSEELLYNPSKTQLKDPTANWASFRYYQFGVDITAPTLNCSFAGNAGSNGWYRSNVTETCSATDQNFVRGVTGSGFRPLTLGIQGTQTYNPSASTNVGANKANATVPAPIQQVFDLAGNGSNFITTLFSIDKAPPTITATFSPASENNTFRIGSTVSITIACKDVGSGLANCGNQALACPLAPAVGALSYSFAPQKIDTSTLGLHVLPPVAAVDCAGNTTQREVQYTIIRGDE